MNKETSSRVSSIAANVLQMDALTPTGPDDKITDEFNNLLIDAKILAGSALSQDETAGTRPEETFLTRLQRERDDLDDRLGKLVDFIHGDKFETLTHRHRVMLDEQNRLMSELLAVLDERLCDLQITARSAMPETVRGDDDPTGS